MPIGENGPKMETGGNFDAFPSGKYTLQIADINVVMESYMGNAEEEKFKFTFFVLNDVKFMGSDNKEKSTRGRKLWKSFSKFVSPGANLFKFIKVLDPNFALMTAEQKQSYHLDSLIGRQIDTLVSKTPSKKDDTVYYNNIGKDFEKCEKELEEFKDLPGKPVVYEKTSVPATAPTGVSSPAPAGESSADFINGLKKDNEAAKTNTASPVETEIEKKKREAEEAIAKIKKDAGLE